MIQNIFLLRILTNLTSFIDFFAIYSALLKKSIGLAK